MFLYLQDMGHIWTEQPGLDFLFSAEMKSLKRDVGGGSIHEQQNRPFNGIIYQKLVQVNQSFYVQLSCDKPFWGHRHLPFTCKLCVLENDINRLCLLYLIFHL